jgi:hypothetical protein
VTAVLAESGEIMDLAVDEVGAVPVSDMPRSATLNP